MDILIHSTTQGEKRLYTEMTCGNTSAFVSAPLPNADADFQVICQNSHHRAWKGSGRFFPTLADALAGYKSPEMRAMINAAASLAEAPL
jgi:hypothetical protein